MVMIHPPIGVPIVDPTIKKAYILNQDVEAHKPETDAKGEMMGDDEKDDDTMKNQQI